MAGYTTFIDAIKLGRELDCAFLFGLDGGDSSAMYFKGESIKSSSRAIQDAVYFISIEK